MEQNRKKDFKALQEWWYCKLKEEGFRDIEDHRRQDCNLKSWHSWKFYCRNKKLAGSTQAGTIDQARITREFFERATQIREIYRFKSRLHARIWDLFCDGLSEREIAEKIKYKYKKSMVHYVISQISKEIRCK